MSDQKSPPLQTFRDGAIFVKVWEQQGKNGPYVTATMGRTYQDDRTGEYGDARSFTGTDLLKLQALMGEAHKEMTQWRDYYRVTGRTRDPDQTEQQTDPQAGPQAEQAAPDPTAQQSMAAQRDAALAQAKQPDRGQSRSRERTPEQ